LWQPKHYLVQIAATTPHHFVQVATTTPQGGHHCGVARRG
jgi:hypothetical protein